MTFHFLLKHYIIKHILLISILAAVYINVSGRADVQNIRFTNISIKNGLSQSSPNCIFQDSRGIVWIGTEDGLNKYDGYDFTVYKPMQDDPESISNSRILSIAEDPTGNLWIGTNGGGLNKYIRNENCFHIIHAENDTLVSAGDVIHSVMPNGKNELWIGTDKGLFLLNIDSEQYTDIASVYPELKLLSTIPVNKLLHDREIIWIGSTEGLFGYHIQRKTLTHYVNNPSDNQSLHNNHVTTLLADRYQNLIVGTESGISVMNKESGVFKKLTLANNNKEGNLIKDLMEDNVGNLWIADYGNGLFIGSAESGQFENYVYDHLNPYSLRNNEVLSLFKDFSGLIWVGSNGIDIYNPLKDKFVLYDYVPYTHEQLVFRNIHPIYLDPEGILWIGSKTDGLHILDRENKRYTRLFHNPESRNSLSSNRIRAICEYPAGVLWIGTENAGIDKVSLDANRRPVSYKNFKHGAGNTNSLTSNKIYSFYADNNGKLWIGTDNGLTIMDIGSETFTQYMPDNSNPGSISNATVYAIYCDKQNNIWLATDLGINRFDPASGGFIHYVHDDGNENSVVHNEILCFHEDKQGNLWIGTYGKGFDKYDPVHNMFTHFSDIREISTAVIYGILEDNQGNLWMSSNNGLIKFNEKSRELKIFDIEDGLQSNEFNGTSYFVSKTGEMFFGGQFGFNSFYPNEVLVDTVIPTIIISDLLVHNISISPGENSPIDKYINEAKEINLNYKQNNFTLYFSALHFANPSRNRYKYKLEGFDKEWIDAGNKRFVSYTNLPYKSYNFRVIASNSDGVWNNAGLSVRVKIRPPLWATIWFRIIAGIIIIGGLFFLVRRRLTRDERQKKIIEEKFAASSKELEEARQQLENQHTEIIIQKRELVARQKDQENLLWFNQGLGLFSDLVSKNRENLTQLCNEFIKKLVDYVEAQQGGVFLLNQDQSEEYLELVAYYAFTSARMSQRFYSGEGYVGACFKDKKFIEIDNLSENYSEFSSGLGSVTIRHLLFAPLLVTSDCIGVIELGSFKKIKGYRISFVEKLVENIASIILTEQANKKLKDLIEHSTKQGRELTENEEQMRQNLEELIAAQEESSRREDELIKLAEESATREEQLNQEIEELRQRILQLSK